MKRVLITVSAFMLVSAMVAQTGPQKYGKVEVLEQDGKTTVTIGGDLVVVEEGQDTTKIKLGKKGVTIIEDESGSSSVEWEDLKDIDESENENGENGDEGPQKKKFKPHWAGLEFGLNNYVNSDWSMNISPSYMDLNTSRSWNFNLNFLEYGLGLGTDKIGLVTGLGLEWMNYHFDGNNVIIENAAGFIEEFPIAGAVDKAKFQTTYLTAPLLLEFQIPAGKKRVYISGGVIGGVKLGAKTKVVYRESGDKQKDKVKDDFNLNALRYGFTARLGYRNLKLFANYYPVSLFESGKGTGEDQLYPFAIGLNLLSF